jgi:hypothetical protein
MHEGVRYGTDVPQVTHEMLARALELPSIPERSETCIRLFLGERTLGWQVLGQSQERPGPALDLTLNLSAILHLRALPEQVSPLHPSSSSSAPRRGRESVDVTGTIFGSDIDGVVEFLVILPCPGRWMGEVRLTSRTGATVRSPRHIKFTVQPSLECY